MSGFAYYYKRQAGQFVFYRIPKVLFSEKRFAGLSTDAKVLYGLMLDRMGLSRENEWYDRMGRVFIFYRLETVMESLHCGKEKANKLMAELDERGIGLIETKRQGLGRPNIIYVKDFSSE